MRQSQANRKIEDFASEAEMVPEEWAKHEHVAGPLNKEAQHLVHLAGSAELAKRAIDELQELLPSAPRDELARDLGYSNVAQMMEQTEIVPLATGSFTHLTTDSDGYWVAWSEKPFYDIQRFSSRQDALRALRECNDSISLQS